MDTHDAVDAEDRIGRIEQAGVEYIPENARDSRPRNVFAVFVGSNFTWAIAIFGWLPMSLGLDFWSALTSTILGLALGCVIVAPVAIIGPRTGTNMTVASGAHFGIRGRLIGTAIALLLALVFAAQTVWTSGDAIVAAAHRAIGTTDGDWAKAIVYALVSVGIVVVAVYGHATIVALQKLVIPMAGGLLLVGFVAFIPHFDPSARIADYALGGYWQTWILSFVLAFVSAPTYVTNVGDYTRRIPRSAYSDLQVAAAVGLGIFVGNLVPMVFGMFSAAAFTNPTDSYVDDLIAASPVWYVAPIVIIAMLGGFGQGVLNLYSSGLDLEGLFPRLRRVQTTAITAVISVGVLYAGVFLVSAVDALTASTLVLAALILPWTAIMVIGAIRHRRTGYDADDLQAFAQGRRGGRYWFTNGWNIPAVGSWLAGSVFGILAVNCPLYVGPFANLAGGIDLSCLGSGVITAALYLLFTHRQSADTPTGLRDGKNSAGEATEVDVV
jgi:purine-cytosine permease-like protein